ncbi:MAG: helix-turn-helix domain-containing protein [Bryobacteraceae bacterium]|nr:helix-turn-helix domain-containing protein [Solibacteraceae bacterium]MCO5351102.1 helix-turn-helix domain-containing protein [Bryobacteraceae bacterium]
MNDKLTLRDALTTRQAAELIGVPTKQLVRWTAAGHGPAHFKFGQTARYRREDVLAWLRLCRRESAVTVQALQQEVPA